MRRPVAWAVLLACLVLSALAWAAAFPAVLRIPAKDPAAPRALPAARFSHPTHQSLGCYGCHPSIFPQAPLGFSHADMRQGRYCGQCHDGRFAFSIQKADCGRCHAP